MRRDLSVAPRFCPQMDEERSALQEEKNRLEAELARLRLPLSLHSHSWFPAPP